MAAAGLGIWWKFWNSEHEHSAHFNILPRAAFFVRNETPKTGGLLRASRDLAIQAGARPSIWRGKAMFIFRTLRKQSKLPIPNSREIHCFPYGPRPKRERQSKPWGHAGIEASWQAAQ